MINLGDEVVDRITGFRGIAVARHDYLNGCARYSVQPKVAADGKLPECGTFDEITLETVEVKVVPMGSRAGGGPEKYMPKDLPIG